MRPLFLLVLTFIFADCALGPIEQGKAINIAYHELERHRVDLTKITLWVAEPGKKIDKFGPVTYVWAITFRVPDSKKPSYLVYVNQFTGNVELYWDYRHVRSHPAQ